MRYRVFPDHEDCPHPPGQDPLWQESAVFTWYDHVTGIGGFWRLGQEVNAGRVNSCFGVFSKEGLRFRNNVSGAAMVDADRSDTHMAFGRELRLDLDSVPRITANFPECSANLRFDGFHPRYDYSSLIQGGDLPESSSGHKHIEVSGTISGKMRIGEKTWKVNALAHRDRSWGRRDWPSLRVTRWWPCVFGPDLSVQLVNCVTSNGDFLKLGYMRRGEQVIPIVDTDMLCLLEPDGFTVRRAEASFRLDNGEEHRVVCEPVDGIVMYVRGFAAIEAIGVARLGERTGFCGLEAYTNASGGEQLPSYACATSNMTEGLSRRA
jgi:hypothetical protein